MTTRRLFAQKKIIEECDNIEVRSASITYPLTPTDNTAPQVFCFDSQGKAAKRAASSFGIDTVAYSTSSNANGGSIAGDTLTLYASSAATPGLNSTIAQAYGGEKTYNDGVQSLKRYRMPNTTDATTGVVEWSTTGNLKRMKIHNYSSFPDYSNNIYIGGGDGLPESQAGNFANTATDNVGLGDGVLFRVTTGSGNTCIKTGNQITTASDNILIHGAQALTTASNLIVIGNTALHANNGAGVGTLNDSIIIGNSACRDSLNSQNLMNSVIIGPQAGRKAQGVEDSILITARENTIPALANYDVLRSVCMNCDLRTTTEVEDVIGIKSNLAELSSLTGREKIYLNYPSTGTGANAPMIKIGGIYDSSYNTGDTAAVTNVLMQVVDDTHRLSALPLPGMFGRFHQTVSDFNYVNKAIGGIVPFSGSITANVFCHTVANTFVVDIGGIFDFQFRFQCVTEEANLIWFVRKNGVNLISQQNYIGKAIVGLENAPCFHLAHVFDAGDIIDFTIQGNSDPGAGNIQATGAHSISVFYSRNMEDITHTA
jgi:hypothetical protein